MFGVGWSCILVACIPSIAARNRPRNARGRRRDGVWRQEVFPCRWRQRLFLGLRICIRRRGAFSEDGRLVHVRLQMWHVATLRKALPPPVPGALVRAIFCVGVRDEDESPLVVELGVPGLGDLLDEGVLIDTAPRLRFTAALLAHVFQRRGVFPRKRDRLVLDAGRGRPSALARIVAVGWLCGGPPHGRRG